jgi:thioesterase domain-containing protein
VLAAQPRGPVRLGGYCVGGIVALEVARQLEAAGRDIEFVVLIDSPSLNGRAGMQALSALLGAVARVLPRNGRARVASNGMWAAWVLVRSRPVIWGALRKLGRLTAVKLSAGRARPPRWDEYRRLSNYIPVRSATPLHCFVCAENADRIDFKPSNWHRLMPAVQATVIPGDHHSCVTRFADVLAGELQGVMSIQNEQGRADGR